MPSDRAVLQEMHLFMRLAREWDLRFEKLFRTGRVSKWYSSVGNEGITVPAATAIEAGDGLVTLHRDSGAILRYYLRTEEIAPPGFPAAAASRRAPTADSKALLYRLACQMLGKQEGFSRGRERSYHYGLIEESEGLVHMGMISHLGAMIPVAAGLALGFRNRGSDRVAINFIGDGGTSTGDFHEALNMAAVLRLPFILIIENNQYAFSTPTHEQYASQSLADRAVGYGIPGVQVNGSDAGQMLSVMDEAVRRARAGEGPTLIEAHVGRLRGHSEGDDSFLQVPEEERERFLALDPLRVVEQQLLDSGVYSEGDIRSIEQYTADLIVQTVDKAIEAEEPDTTEERDIYAD